MKLGWNDQNELAPEAALSRFKQAEIGSASKGECDGALLLLLVGTATHANGEFSPARKATCIWLSREDAGHCELSDSAEGFVVMVRFPPERKLEATSRIVVATPLLYAIVERLAEVEIETCPMRASYENVATEEILRDLDVKDAAQIPRSPQLQLWARRFMNTPRVSVSVTDAAKDARMSVRSFARHFKRETGEDFRSWKKRTLINKARAMLYIGHTISEVSSELAYESVSSFVSMFKNSTGKTPGDYVREPKVWSEHASRRAIEALRVPQTSDVTVVHRD